MSSDAAYFGIDFGTTNSSMAWYDPQKGEAKILRNAEGEEKTPSLVYYGEEDDEVLIGRPAEEQLDLLEETDDPHERDEIARRLVRSIKRNLLKPPLIPNPGREPVRPVEVVALILGKLKGDAEKEHFYEEIERVVITCPAIFGSREREVLLEAADMAGFGTVEVLQEPVAAALTVHRLGQKIGKGVLVYDLGAGTFDLSVVARREDGSFYVPMEPEGDDRFGGDDLDLALYRHCDGIARGSLGRPISPTGEIDPVFRKQCRSRKENLSNSGKSGFGSRLLSEDDIPQRFRHEIDRETFESLIRERIEGTVHKTARLIERAEEQGREVETVVLIGWSSRVPLVKRLLAETLPVEPHNFAEKDYAVALGAAYHAFELWNPASPKPKSEAGVGREGITSEREIPDFVRRPTLKPGGWTVEDVRDVELSRTLTGHSDQVWSVAFSPDGTLLASSGGNDKTIRLWDAQTGKPLRTLIGHSDWVVSVAFSPDGSLLASGGNDGTTRLWDPQTGAQLRVLTEHSDSVISVAFSPDGSLLASGSEDKTISLCNAKTNEPLHTLTGHSSFVWSVAFSPDGQLLASGSDDGTVKLWNAKTGAQLRTLIGHSSAVYSVAFSPDGQLLASGNWDGTVKLWDPQTGAQLRILTVRSAQLRILPVRSKPVYSVAFSPDGRLLASGRYGGSIELWEAITGELLCDLTEQYGFVVSSVAFSPDEQLLVSGCGDGTIRLWTKA